jgi:hypothetical protein
MIALVLSLIFVSHRARAFHHCMGFREQTRVVSVNEPCRSDEQPLEWELLGYPARLKLVGTTILKTLWGELNRNELVAVGIAARKTGNPSPLGYVCR